MADADVMQLSCRVADYDATTGVCAAPFYTYPPSALPTLSVADAQTIGWYVALAMATAYVYRMLKRALEIG